MHSEMVLSGWLASDSTSRTADEVEKLLGLTWQKIVSLAQLPGGSKLDHEKASAACKMLRSHVCN